MRKARDIMAGITVTDLAAVVYSAGKVFDGLQTGRLDTEEFLRTGDTGGVSSMHDLALLQDLKAAAALVITRGSSPIDGEFLQQLNASMTRSASIQPGALRRNDEGIGVSTVYGRHEPRAVSPSGLQRLVARTTGTGEAHSDAAGLFLAIAKAQPFKDGNKRTGIFAANALLLQSRTTVLLTAPFVEDDPTVSQEFNDKLARAYMFDEDGPVIDMLLERGIVSTPGGVLLPRRDAGSRRMRELKEKIAKRVVASESAGFESQKDQ